jgi:hypothetical protein
MRDGFAALVGALLLAGCASSPRPALAPQEMVWVLLEADRPEPTLLYGLPESDVIDLTLECRPGSGAVLITLFGPAKRAARHMTIVSGSVHQRVPARTEPDGLFDQIHQAVAPVSSPALARFAATGEIAIGLGRARAFPPPPAQSRRRFFAACRATN